MSSFNAKDYWEKRLAKTKGLAGVGYAGLGGAFNSWMYRVRRRIFLSSLKKQEGLLAGKRVLDVGCGTGFYIERWKELGFSEITGADLTEVAVKRLSSAYPNHKFVQADITAQELPFGDNEFHVISAFDVLFHVVDDELFERALKNIHSLLAPKGYFVWSDNFLKERRMLAEHQVCRSLNEVESHCSEIGFEIVDRCPMFYFMNAPVDSDSRILRKNWHIIQRYFTKNEWLGWLYGALLYPVELIALTLAKEGPSTEMMICRKK